MTVFGQMPDGSPVHRIAIRGGGLRAHVLTYGAVLQDLWIEGHDAPLVLGFAEFAPYLTDSPYFGAIAGRCANRIRDGHLELDGRTHQLDRNFLGKHMLHGGARGFGKRNWDLIDHRDDSVTLALVSEDGDMGFPGRLRAEVTYTLEAGGTLDIRLTATCDAPTLCNLAHHSYFTLGGDDISEHLLWIDADHYLPVDDELIPTGQIAPVAGTRFDFTKPHPLKQARPVDHNYCLARARGPLRPCARLENPATGLIMELRTTEPGLQVYDGAKIDIARPGLTGRPMGPHAGLALEPQTWPDANHHPEFPQAILRPGETYRQHTQYIFGKTGP